MYIAKGMYRTTEPAETTYEALIQLLVSSTNPVQLVNNSLEVTLKIDGYDESIYNYSTEWTPYEALKDAMLSNYKKFNITLYKEI